MSLIIVSTISRLRLRSRNRIKHVVLDPRALVSNDVQCQEYRKRSWLIEKITLAA